MRLTCLFCLLLSITACSSARNPYSSSTFSVSGKVFGADGKPIPHAEVLLFPKAKGEGVFGREGTGITDQEGAFVIKSADGKEGVPGGFYGVVIRPHGTPAEKKQALAKVPQKLWQEDSTDMEVEITADKTNWDIRLSK